MTGADGLRANHEFRFGIAGAGAMGAGIAALAAGAGIETVLYDVSQASLDRALERIQRAHARAVERAEPGAGEPIVLADVLKLTTELRELAGSVVILEAAPEDVDLKAQLLAQLAALAPDATLASNTSSIQIGELARRSRTGPRLVGLHFFNPPERMRLVELISTGQAAQEHLGRARELALALGKHVISVRDSPGFLVNRCARPYYLEAIRIVEDGTATVADVDRACVEQGGFPLGPFELIDLIGVDVNLASTRAMFEQADGEPRWRPAPLQRSMVAAGRLGRKSGGGFYADGRGWRDEPAGDPLFARQLLERVVSQLVNEAAFAVAEGVAGEQDIDEAMVIGLNHPHGPGEWSRRLGPARIVEILDGLWEREHDSRYRVAPTLRRAAGQAPGVRLGRSAEQL